MNSHKKTEKQNRLEKRILITPELVRKIARIDEIKGIWKTGVRLNPRILNQLKKSVIITSTGASTRIEGSEMSDAEVARFLRGITTKPPKNRDEEEVAGYADLTGRIFENYKKIRLTEGYILQLHKILLQFSKKDTLHLGKYKASDNIVVAKTDKGEEQILFRPTKPYLVKKEMDDVIGWTNKTLREDGMHPIVTLCNFIFEFLAIHPFIDGNGRLSRALTNLLLLQSDYAYIPYVSLEEIIENRQEDYYQSLRTTQKKHKTKDEDITPWLHFMLDVLLEQAKKAQAIMESGQPEKMLSEKQVIVYETFSTDEELSVADITTRLAGAIPRPTIKHALSRMTELKILERIGQGRGTRYRRIKMP